LSPVQSSNHARIAASFLNLETIFIRSARCQHLRKNTAGNSEGRCASDSPIAKREARAGVIARIKSRMQSMISSSTLISIMPMLMPASVEWRKWKRFAFELAKAVRELAKVLTGSEPGDAVMPACPPD